MQNSHFRATLHPTSSSPSISPLCRRKNRPASFYSGVYTIMTLPTALSRDRGIISFIHLSLLSILHRTQRAETSGSVVGLGWEQRAGPQEAYRCSISISLLCVLPRPLVLGSFSLPLLLCLRSVWALERPGALLLHTKCTN